MLMPTPQNLVCVHPGLCAPYKILPSDHRIVWANEVLSDNYSQLTTYCSYFHVPFDRLTSPSKSQQYFISNAF